MVLNRHITAHEVLENIKAVKAATVLTDLR
jgi:hypothetical protein